AGRTFLSGGPVITFKGDGHEGGDTGRLPGDGGVVEGEARGGAIFPGGTLQGVQQGKGGAGAEDSKGARQLRPTTKLAIDGHTWLAARASGPGYHQPLRHYDGWARGVMAHTSPIYVAVGGDWWLFDPRIAQYLLTLIDGTLSYIRELSPRYRP